MYDILLQKFYRFCERKLDVTGIALNVIYSISKSLFQPFSTCVSPAIQSFPDFLTGNTNRYFTSIAISHEQYLNIT